MTFSPLEARRLLAAISGGVRVNATISSSQQVDAYTLEVPAGAPFLVAVHQTSGNGEMKPHLKVLSPGNSTVYEKAATNGYVGIIPTASTGTYTVQVSAAGTVNNTYSLIVYRPQANVTENDLIAADSSHRFASSMDPNDVDFFTIDTTAAGQTVTATVSQNIPNELLDPKLTLIAPNGEIVGQQGSEEGVRLEDQADSNQVGRYYAVITDDGNNDSGVYGITMTRVPGPQYAGDADTQPLASGVTRNVDIPAGDADVLPISGVQPGDALDITLARTSGSELDPDIVLYDPSGASVSRGTRTSDSSNIRYTALSSGTYWLMSRDFEADDGGSATIRYTLTTPVGTQRINGTAGNDSIIVTSTSTSLKVKLNGVTTSYNPANFGNFEILSGDGNDSIDMRGSSFPTYVSAGSGDDTVYGSSGNDSLTGGAGRNRLFGGDGEDRLNGSGGRDFLYGEGGNDRLYGQGGNDYIDGGGNNDKVYGGDGDDSLFGGNSNDIIYAGAGNDTLIGGKGNDYLNGESGTDLGQAKEAGDTLISIESQA